jgi:multicomponent Na+:H+ antiporter subunit C
VTETSPSLVLVLLVGALFGTGVYLLLERSLSRVLVGVTLVGNGANLLLLLAGGAAGAPPLVGVGTDQHMADPLPQALVLTAIVITLGLSAFLLAMAFRSWQLQGHDEVQDDLEDRRIARRVARGDLVPQELDDIGATLAQEAVEVRDETVHGEAREDLRAALEESGLLAGQGPPPRGPLHPGPHHPLPLSAPDEDGRR